MNSRVLLTIASVLVTLIVPVSLRAQSPAPWVGAEIIQPQEHDVVQYGTLGVNAGQYYRLRLNQPANLALQIAIATNAPAGFRPQIVVFTPDAQTIGPLLPIAQPTETIATLLPTNAHRVQFEPFTQVFSKTTVDAQEEFGAGETYIAVYNAGNTPGRYRLTVSAGSALVQWQDAWQLPVRWWNDQGFAGWGWQSLLTPLLVALAIWAVWLRLQHHNLHPQPRRPVTKATKKKRS
ncbi:MAG: hypothetical protein HY975_02330 [Candidatus Kerfeldbacteria bacterium]|nr:hypothetical protein [Candidatus Kerfeldbacteria bacterium]